MPGPSPMSDPGSPDAPAARWTGAASAPGEGQPPLGESELLSRYRQAVADFARLCTTGGAAAEQLAAEGIGRGIRRARAEGGAQTLPWLPLLLSSVREAAADWQRGGDGGLLDPELRRWLAGAEERAPRRRTLVLRAFQDMPEPERSLLWAWEVECASAGAASLPAGAGTVPAEAEAARIREVFRERCLRLHTREAEAAQDRECRGYVKLLEAVTRKPGTARPEDLRRHLGGCARCREAAACLSLRAEAFPYALATAVLGWAGPAYADLRRRAPLEATGRRRPRLRATGRRRARHAVRPGIAGLLGAAPVRRDWAAAASVVAGLAAVAAALAGPAHGPRRPAAAQVAVMAGEGRPTAPRAAASSATAAPAQSHSAAPVRTAQPMTAVAHRADASPSPSLGTPPTAAPTATATPPAVLCTVRYRLDGQWPGGFRAEVSVRPREAVSGWQLAWDVPDGQQITSMWNGTYVQQGGRILVTPLGYDTAAGPGQPVRVGFLGSWPYGGAAPRDFTFDGAPCAVRHYY